MRTLKKTLALVLVIAMALSVGVIGANAAYTDTADSDYTEAIDVMSAIGVFNGMTTTTFEPTGSLTREQAAKIVCYMMLGPVNAELVSSATTSSFDDVAADRWSAGYIEYCANLGIINGVGEGKFDPAGELTTAAFTKMLLCALGYDAGTEGFTGSTWAINVASTAVPAGVYDSSIAISATTVCTREQACQLAFKALTAKTVEYIGGSEITVGGVTFKQGATRNYVVNAETTGYIKPLSTTSGTTTTYSNDKYMQFCENHFTKLSYMPSTADDFGRPAHKWYNGAALTSKYLIGTYVATAVATYTTAVKSSVLYADLTSAGYTLPDQVAVVRNGGDESLYSTSGMSSDTSYISGTGNGVVLEVYANSSNEVSKLVVVASYIGVATISAKDSTTTPTIDERTIKVVTHGMYGTGSDSTLDLTLTPLTTEGFDDVYEAITANTTAGVTTYVVVTPKGDNTASDTALTVAVAESVSGVLSGYTGDVSLVVGGTSYKYAKVATDSDTSLTGMGGKSVTLYFDSLGYVLMVTGVSTVDNYAVVVAAGSSSDGLGGSTYNAKIVKADGTVEVVQTETSATGYIGWDTTPEPDVINRQDIVSYTVSSTTGVYKLSDASATDLSGTISVKNGVSKFTWDGSTFYATASTVFIVRSGAGSAASPYTYASYTGFSAVPGLSGSSVRGQVLASDGIAKVVYVTGAIGTASTTGTVYLTGTYYETWDDVSGEYCVANAVVDGEATTVKLAGTPTKGLYAGISYDANGVGTVIGSGLGESSYVYTAEGTVAMKNSIIGFGSGESIAYYTYTSDCQVFYITAWTSATSASTGVASASTIGGIGTDANDSVIFQTNSSGIVTAIYVQVDGVAY